jgi:outer membrane protein
LVRLNAGAACKLIGALLAVLVLLPPSANAQSAATKIGYVDLKRLLDDAPQMVESRAKLEREFAPRDDALKADEAKLVALKQRYDRDSAIMSKEDAEARKREIDALDRANKRTREDLRNELNTRAAAERDRAWQQIQNSAIEYARAQGYDLIVPGPVIYFSPTIDITDAVLDKLKRPGQATRSKP